MVPAKKEEKFKIYPSRYTVHLLDSPVLSFNYRLLHRGWATGASLCHAQRSLNLSLRRSTNISLSSNKSFFRYTCMMTL